MFVSALEQFFRSAYKRKGELTVLYYRIDVEKTKYCALASKKISGKKAVARNRVKRRIREAMRQAMKKQTPNYPVQWVLMAQKGASTCSWNSLQQEVEEHWNYLQQKLCSKNPEMQS